MSIILIVKVLLSSLHNAMKLRWRSENRLFFCTKNPPTYIVRHK